MVVEEMFVVKIERKAQECLQGNLALDPKGKPQGKVVRGRTTRHLVF